MKIIEKMKVKNLLGLHIRPAAMIIKILQSSKSKVSFTYRKETINARSIMSILTLAAKQGATIIVTVEGKDAERTVGNLKEAFNEAIKAWKTIL